jgi:hypothetical protein
VKKTRKKSGQRFARIKALRCHQEVYERLVAGYPPSEVARFLQEDENEYTDITRRSLGELLRRYTAAEIAPIELIAPRLPRTVARAQQEFDDRLRDLRRLEAAYEALAYRLALAHGAERRHGTVNPAVDRQIRVLVDLIVKMHTIKLALGLTGERLAGDSEPSAERIEEVRQRYGDPAARAFADPAQRAQVFALLKRVRRLSGKLDMDNFLCASGAGDAGATACPGAANLAEPSRTDGHASFDQDDDDGLRGQR